MQLIATRRVVLQGLAAGVALTTRYTKPTAMADPNTGRRAPA
jgi:hypothetical protein